MLITLLPALSAQPAQAAAWAGASKSKKQLLV
jgi:hypothetical protein